MPSLEAIIDRLLTSDRLPLPASAHIDPVGNLCQLRCPLCPVGAQVITRDRLIMPFETFSTLLGKMPFLGTLDLYRSGEPFLNPELLTMIRYARDRNIEVVTSTHFSFAKPAPFFDDLVASGLQRLVVSLDGASPETYGKYRIGGDFELVMANIKSLIAAKKRAQSATPRIVWQFIVNRYNEQEIAAARAIAASLGITLELRPISLGDNEPDVPCPRDVLLARKRDWLPQNPDYVCDCYQGEYGYPLFKGICHQLFTRVVVLADGALVPCCEARERESAIGNLLTASFDSIWYGQPYRAARARALHGTGTRAGQPVCFRCNNYGTAPSLKDKLRLVKLVYGKSLRKRWRHVVATL